MNSKHSQIWLFAFADLAFLLLIAFTQIPHTDIEKISLPRVPSSKNSKLTAPSESYKLYVHSQAEESYFKKPFQLVLFKGEEKYGAEEQLPEAQLKDKLLDLSKRTDKGPILWPAPSARTEDMLIAYSYIKIFWPDSEVVIAVMPEKSIEGIVK